MCCFLVGWLFSDCRPSPDWKTRHYYAYAVQYFLPSFLFLIVTLPYLLSLAPSLVQYILPWPKLHGDL